MASEKQYIAGVSGGSDSMLMLKLYQKKIACVVHVNYNTRSTSLRDQKLVEQYCQKLNIPLVVHTVDPDLVWKKNFQNQARKIRFDQFKKTAKLYQINKLLLAHHRDDFIEQAKMQLDAKKRAVYYGIKTRCELYGLKIYRPLMKYWKDEIIALCRQDHIPYEIDETNKLPIYKRNEVRLEIEKWSKIEKEQFYIAICAMNKTIAQKLFVLMKKAKKWLLQPDVRELKRFSIIDQKQLIYSYLIYHKINVNGEKIDAILDFIQPSQQKQYRLQNDIFLMVKNQCLALLYKS
ncbi:tRNA lysidine(34) synthetase TilS [Mycoplasmoides genitalium]